MYNLAIKGFQNTAYILKDHMPHSYFLVLNKYLGVILLSLGSFNDYVDRILPFFDPPPLRGKFLYPKRGLKQTIFDPLPPHLVHVVIE